MYTTSNCFILCKNIGLKRPTTVVCNGKELTTQGLDISSLVSTWRKEFFDYGDQWLCLGLTHKDFKSITKRPFVDIMSVAERFYEEKIICIDVDEIARAEK